jgi:hypothetical protein
MVSLLVVSSISIDQPVDTVAPLTPELSEMCVLNCGYQRARGSLEAMNYQPGAKHFLLPRQQIICKHLIGLPPCRLIGRHRQIFHRQQGLLAERMSGNEREP